MMEYFVVVFIYKMQQLEIGCVGNIIFFQKYYRQLKKKGSYIHIYRDVTSCYTRVHIFPPIIKVAVPHPQHSPWLGHLPLVQIVFR